MINVLKACGLVFKRNERCVRVVKLCPDQVILKNNVSVRHSGRRVRQHVNGVGIRKLALRENNGRITKRLHRSLDKYPEELVIPVMFKACQRLELKRIAFRVGHLDVPEVARPVPDCEFNVFVPFVGRGIEHSEESGDTVSGLRHRFA